MIGADLVRAATLVPVAVAGLGRAATVGARGRRVRDGDGRELLRAGIRCVPPVRGGAAERPAGERPRPRDRQRPRRRRLGTRGCAPRGASARDLLRDERRLVRRLGAPARRRLVAPARNRCARGAAEDPRGIRGAPAVADARRRRRGDRGRRDRDGRDVDRRSARARPVVAGGGSRRVRARDGRLRARGDRRRRRAGTATRAAKGASLLSWSLYLPAYLLLAVAASLPVAAAGAFFAGVGQSAAVVLAYSAAQEEVRDEVLGRVTGLISLVHRGAHATGLGSWPRSSPWPRRRPSSPWPPCSSR